MGRLHVAATTRWASGTPDFTGIPIMVVLSVTDDTGSPVTGLQPASLFVRYLESPDHGSSAIQEAAFHEHHSGFPMAAGFYSFVVSPSDELSPPAWLQDQIFLLITLRGGGNQGQAVCLATYHQVTGPF